MPEALILAGGRGTRLRTVVADRPKVLAEVNGRPFLAYLLADLAAAGVPHAVLCTGYLAHQVETAFGTSYASMRLSYSPELTPLGTGGALRLALEHTRSPTLLALNGDSFLDLDFSRFLQAHAEHQADITMAVVQVHDATRYGRVSIGPAERILSFDEKGAHHGPGCVNAGIYALARDRLAEIPLGIPLSLEREAFPDWLRYRFHAWRAPGRFLDIGTPESYAEASRFLHSRRPG